MSPEALTDNVLYYGDNLDVLRRHVSDESIDLVYLDPPFNSNASYNVLFAEHGVKAAAQVRAFEDTWQWNTDSRAAYEEVVEGGGPVANAMRAFHTLLPSSDMLAYLAMMAPRLIELHRALKPTGSLWLHCDPTASHYLKLLLDAVFGPKRFLNEVTWKRSSAHSDTKQGMRRCGKIRDILLAYTKADEYTWNPQVTPYTEDYLATEYRHVATDGRRYKETDVTAAKPGGDTEYEWRVKRQHGGARARWQADLTDEHAKPAEGWEYRGVRPYAGRYWAYSKVNLVAFANVGKLIHRETGAPRLMQFADEMPGIPLQDLWDDIPPALGHEELGYPTQKPIALLERIVTASSNAGDVVLDPFCGCGTTIDAAQRLGRAWIGIDVTHLAIGLIRHRLADRYGKEVTSTYRVIGEPTTEDDAAVLARDDPFQFQAWALGLIGARLAGSAKKGGDKGIDGRLFFHDSHAGPTRQVLISVKAGEHLVPAFVHGLRGVMEREGAEIGVLISFAKPSAGMRAEAAEAGSYESPWGRHPRIQLRTIGELLDGKGIDYPHVTGANVTHRRAPRARPGQPDAPELFRAVAEEPSDYRPD